MKLPAGTQVYIGAPVQPLPAELVKRIEQALGDVPGIREAHLPQVYIEGKIDPPAQVLMIVLDQEFSTQLPAIKDALRRILPGDRFMDIFELREDSPILAAVRSAGCKLERHMTI
jgi:hypothetical protein